jgi:predicted kinase
VTEEVLPALIVVTGAPGSGKSTVAEPLAARLRLPLIAKDDVKETLWDHAGGGDRERFLAYGRASYPLLLLFARRTLAAGRSVVLEANFAPEHAAGELEALRADTPFRFVQVLCRADPATCLVRYRERADSDLRHPMHRVGGEETIVSLERRLADGTWERPIPLDGPLFTLDTNSPVDVDALASEIACVVDARRAQASA